MSHAASEHEYNIRFVHAVSPSPKDTDGPFHIPGNAFSDKTRLAKELRAVGALHKGQRIKSFRVEGDKVIVFPQGGRPWHSLIIEPSENYVPHGNVVPSWARRRKRK